MDDNLKTLSLTLYGEARGESIEGIIAVGVIIRNRVRDTGRSYSDICLAPKQFSSWNPDDPNYSILVALSSKMDTPAPILKQCIYIANGIIGGDILNKVGGLILIDCKHYTTQKLYQELKVSQPNHWAMKMRVIGFIGNQVFLKQYDKTTEA
jgi:N-acetylmuramoyl-L-alanine amidase